MCEIPGMGVDRTSIRQGKHENPKTKNLCIRWIQVSPIDTSGIGDQISNAPAQKRMKRNPPVQRNASALSNFAIS